jgi:hypothetical protein
MVANYDELLFLYLKLKMYNNHNKDKLRLNIYQNNFIYYEARRNKNDFIVTIFNPNVQKSKNESNNTQNDKL